MIRIFYIFDRKSIFHVPFLRVRDEAEAAAVKAALLRQDEARLRHERGIIDSLENERSMMQVEEARQIEMNNRGREVRYMQHEDIISFMVRRMDDQKD